VLDCVFERSSLSSCLRAGHTGGFRRSNAVFAMSGISGGSLGLASYAAYLTEKAAGASDNSWVSNRLNGDSLSATGAWWFFVEVPRVFRQCTSEDRAAILEQGWEREWDDARGGGLTQGLFGLWRRHREAPLLMLNGTSVEDGCRLNTSVLDGNVQVGGVPPA